MNEIEIIKSLITSKHDHFIFVEYNFYKKWKWLIKLSVLFNKNYISCEIFRRKYKIYKNIVIIGLKWGGKNVKRRTTGLAKEFLDEKKNARCIYCNRKLNIQNATMDHIVPISKGGNNCQVNLITCCFVCNNERGDIEFTKYLKLKNEKYRNVKEIFI
jgi:hypothetical protein